MHKKRRGVIKSYLKRWFHWVTNWVKTKGNNETGAPKPILALVRFVLTFDGSGWRVRVVSGWTVSPLGWYCLGPEPVSYIDMALQPRGGALCGRSCDLAKLFGVCHFRVLFSFWREFNWNEDTKRSQTLSATAVMECQTAIWPLTLLCMSLNSSLRWQLTLRSCWIFASEALRALFTSINSWTVIGLSDKSEDSELW